MNWSYLLLILVFGISAWENHRFTPFPICLGNGDTLMVRIAGYGFCPLHCMVNHHHLGHFKGYKCGVDTCNHIIYEDKLN